MSNKQNQNLICSRCGGPREHERYYYCGPCKTAYNEEYRRRNIDRLRAYDRCYARRHSERISEAKKVYYQGNTEDCKRRAVHWREQNPDRVAALQGKHSAMTRAPGCLPEDFDFEATIEIYAKSRELTRATGERYEVDHVVPLNQGGCHCSCNLQVLKTTDHYEKTKAEFKLPAE